MSVLGTVCYWKQQEDAHRPMPVCLGEDQQTGSGEIQTAIGPER